MDIYSTVWLSDFESIKSVGSKSFNTSYTDSDSSSFAENDDGQSMDMSHSTPRHHKHSKRKDDVHSSANQMNHTVNLPYRQQPNQRNKVWRTLSLPELQMSTLTGNDLTERFVRLQLEQDNRDLQSMVETLQETIDRVKTSVFPYEAECCTECADSKNTLDSILYELTRTMYRKKQHGEETKIPYCERSSESGYSTLQHSSSFYRTPSLHSQHTNDSQLLSPMEEKGDCGDNDQSDYFQSRLVARRHGAGAHNASCCMVQ